MNSKRYNNGECVEWKLLVKTIHSLNNVFQNFIHSFGYF